MKRTSAVSRACGWPVKNRELTCAARAVAMLRPQRPHTSRAFAGGGPSLGYFCCANTSPQAPRLPPCTLSLSASRSSDSLVRLSGPRAPGLTSRPLPHPPRPDGALCARGADGLKKIHRYAFLYSLLLLLPLAVPNAVLPERTHSQTSRYRHLTSHFKSSYSSQHFQSPFSSSACSGS